MIPQVTVTCHPIIVNGVPGWRADVYCQTGGTPEAFGAVEDSFVKEIGLEERDTTELTPEMMLSGAMETITKAMARSQDKLVELRSG